MHGRTRRLYAAGISLDGYTHSKDLSDAINFREDESLEYIAWAERTGKPWFRIHTPSGEIIRYIFPTT